MGLVGGWSRVRLGGWEREALAVAVVLGALAVATTWLISLGGQLTWDEAVYATKSRSLVTDIPASHWLIYRPPGLPYLGLLAAPFGVSLESLRIVSAAAGIATLAAAWGLARWLWGSLAALVALLALAGAPAVLGRLPVFRNDLISVGPVLLLLILLWWQLERRPRPNAFLLAAAPLAAAAFYLRFGALPLVVGAGVAAVVLWPAALWQHRRLVTLTLALGLLLLVPHVGEAIARTGSPLGIVRSAVEVTDTTGPLTAAVRYARWLPATIAGPAGIAVLAAAAIGGLVAGRQALRARTMTPQVRRYLLVLVPAIAGAIGIVLVSHPEPRYMLGPLALGAIAGGGAVAEGLRRFRRTSVRRRAMGANAALALVAALVVFDAVVGVVWLRGRSDRARVQLDARAGEAIAADARGPCVAVASQIPVTGWYSRCLAVGYGANLTRVRTQLAVGLPAYVVLRTGDDELIGTKKLSRYQRLAVSPPLATIVEETRRATVNRLKP